MPQRLGVVQAQDLDVGGPEAGPLERGEGLRQGGDVAAREDVLADPAVGGARLGAAADGVDQGHAVLGEQPLHLLEILQEERRADMLEHAHRDDPVEGATHIAEVGEAEADPVLEPRVLRPALGHRQLLLRQGHAEHLDAVVGPEIEPQAPPAAADVEHLHPRLQPELGRDVQLLGVLGLLQGHAGPREVGAGILQVAVEEPAIEVLGEVVVVVDVAPRGVAVVPLLQPPLGKDLELLVEAAGAVAPLVAAAELQQIPDRTGLERYASVHVGFTETDGRLGRDLAHAAGGEGDRHLGAAAIAVGFDPPVRHPDREVADADHALQKGVEHKRLRVPLSHLGRIFSASRPDFQARRVFYAPSVRRWAARRDSRSPAPPGPWRTGG